MPSTLPTTSATAAVFRALSDEKRLRIIEMLGDGERCVCDLQADLGLAQSLLSFHLRVLREAGLVSDRRVGRWAFYSLRPQVMDGPIEMLSDLQQRARTLPVLAADCCD